MKIEQIESKRLWRPETSLLSVGVILTVTAGAKLASMFGSAGIPDQPNPLFAETAGGQCGGTVSRLEMK